MPLTAKELGHLLLKRNEQLVMFSSTGFKGPVVVVGVLPGYLDSVVLVTEPLYPDLSSQGVALMEKIEKDDAKACEKHLNAAKPGKDKEVAEAIFKDGRKKGLTLASIADALAILSNSGFTRESIKKVIDTLFGGDCPAELKSLVGVGKKFPKGRTRDISCEPEE